MKFHRIQAMLLRHLFLFRHSIDRLTDVFYWPTIDLLLWGLTSSYIKASNPSATNVVLIIISGILFWLIVFRAQLEITVNVLEELWGKNLINIFVTPLKFSEWTFSLLILGIVKAAISFPFAMMVAYMLYKINIFFYGFYLIPFLLLLLMSGWAVGFFVAGLILRFGSRIQTFAWALVFAFSPFSAIYYPLSILPLWAQKVAFFIPTSYIFEGAREVIAQGMLDMNKIYMSLGLNIIYLTLSLIFLKKSFKKALDKGLIKVY